MPIIRGRDFTETDTDVSTRVVIISDTVAETLWPGQNPLGRRLTASRQDPTLFEVVGVVPAITASPVPFTNLQVYLPAYQHYDAAVSFVVRTPGHVEALIEPLRSALSSVDPQIVVSDAQSVQRAVDLWQTPVRIAAVVLAVLASIGVGIALVGLYGIVSFSVTQRTREFGIRRALGATTLAIYRTVLRSAAVTTAVGIAVGLLAAFLAGGLLTAAGRMLYRINPRDPVAFTVVPLILAAAALAAAALAARRAADVEPTKALKEQ